MEFFPILYFLITTSLMVHLWSSHAEDSILKRLFWSLILCVPILGWLYYGGMYTVPSRQPHALRAKETRGVRSARVHR